MHRILALFRERETRDELGLGAIRDSFSDQLFPGTSTIHTRLRYFFFIPWIYQSLENSQVSARHMPRRAREMELALVLPLLQSDDEAGVFGKTAGEDLKRLPSEVYWAGLGNWGFRRFKGTQHEYYLALDDIYQRRSFLSRRDDGEMGTDSFTVTWHPKIPPPPDSFPEGITFQLTGEEKQFLKDCLVGNHRASLLADLAIHPPEEGVSLERSNFPWEHPRFAGFSEENKKLLYHARLFSENLHGAAILYNFLLADQAERHELADRYRKSLLEWTSDTIDVATHRGWSLDELWNVVEEHGYRVTYPTKDFVKTWLRLVNEAKNPHDLLDSREAHELIRARERRLKRSRSRFSNPRALDQWGGQSGLGQLSYRWRDVQVLLEDLYAGS